MALATTEKFEELVLEVSTDGGTNYARLCGLTDVTITRALSVDTQEVPDCDDESLPLSVEKQGRSIDVSVTGSGVWAQESYGTMSDWFYSSSTLMIRIGNLKALAGQTEYETGPALLTQFDHQRTKGQKVGASIKIDFDGTPARTAKA